MNNSKNKRIFWWILTGLCGVSLLMVVTLGILCFWEYRQILVVSGIEEIRLSMISEPYGTGGLLVSAAGLVAAVFALSIVNKIPEKRKLRIVSFVLLGIQVLATILSLVLYFC